jgi:predicted DNA-binding transcriptional regulator YafY
MARNDRTVRLEVVKRALAESRRGIALKSLAEKHGFKLRNLYRDIDALEAAHFPIRKEDGRYRLDSKVTTLAGAPTPDERLALFLAREQAAGWKHTSLGRALDTLWNRISSTDGQAALFPVETQPWIATRTLAAIDHAQHRHIALTIERATRERLLISARYRAASTGQLTARTLEPGQLYFDPGLETLYLIAWCRLRRDVRVFAVHRFQAVTLLDERCPPRAETRSAAALRKAFRVWRSDRVERVRVWFAPEVAAEVSERRWLAGQTVEAADGGIVVTGEVAGLAEVERWVLSYGAAARVLAPRELADRVAKQLRDGAAGYERAAGGGRKVVQR